jgi:hypothetical protein
MAVEGAWELGSTVSNVSQHQIKLGWIAITNLTVDDGVLRILQTGSLNRRDRDIVRQRGRHVWELSINEVIGICGRNCRASAADDDAANARESEMEFEGRR